MLRRLLIAFACLVPSFAFAGSVSLTSMGVLHNSRIVSYLMTPAPAWGSATIANNSSNTVLVNWTMTLDGTEISYGEWQIPPWTSALLTAINAKSLSMGNHTLTLSYNDNAGDNVTESMTIVVENKPSWWN